MHRNIYYIWTIIAVISIQMFKALDSVEFVLFDFYWILLIFELSICYIVLF